MLPRVIPLKPYLREMIWGGRRLWDKYRKALPPGRNFGESWEVSAYPGMESIVAAGALSGRLLSDLVESHGRELLGGAAFERYNGEFPLLVKLLDAHQDLSIQVHPRRCIRPDEKSRQIREDGGVVRARVRKRPHRLWP